MIPMVENDVPPSKPAFFKRFLSCSVIALTAIVLGGLIALPFLPMILKPMVGDIFRRGYDTFYITDSLNICVRGGRLPESWKDLKIGFDPIYGDSYRFEGFENSDAFFDDMTTRIDVNFELFRKINRHLDAGDIDNVAAEIPEVECWVFRWEGRPISKKFQREKFDELFQDVKRYAVQRMKQNNFETNIETKYGP